MKKLIHPERRFRGDKEAFRHTIFPSARALNPVPAGIKRTMMTFSFSPRKESFLPETAASIKTLEVCWNEAA